MCGNPWMGPWMGAGGAFLSGMRNLGYFVFLPGIGCLKLALGYGSLWLRVSVKLSISWHMGM